MYPSVLNLLEGADHRLCDSLSLKFIVNKGKQLMGPAEDMENDPQQQRIPGAQPLYTPPTSRGKEGEETSSEERRRSQFEQQPPIQKPLFRGSAGSPVSLVESPQSATAQGSQGRRLAPYETLEPGPALQQNVSSETPPIAIPRATPTLQPGTLAARRRSFRKRRKDPSCDGCKDRKVKCDATSTTSCSECLQRGITCKFTKQGNRKMSAAKQVQELEKQLLQSQQQNHLLRSMLKGTGTLMQSSGAAPSANAEVARPPAISRGRQPLKKPGLVVRHIRRFSDGVFKAPPPYREQKSESPTDLPSPPLPARITVERLTDNYQKVFTFFSVVRHWPRFLDSLNTVYEAGTFTVAPRAWTATFFAILALGTLQEVSENMSESHSTALSFLQHALEHTRNWSEDDITVQHCSAALLISVFYFESNLRSCARLWLVTAVSMASEIGLNEEHGPWSPEEVEERRHVWWTIYFWDRLMAIETLNAPLIDENECTINLPRPLHELDNDSQLAMAYTPENYNSAVLSLVVPFIRLLAPIRHLSNVQVIQQETLDMFVNSLADLEDRLPDLLQPANTQHIDPSLLRVTTIFSNARLLLHRHNLSPTVPSDARSAALQACTSAALATVHIINRSLELPNGTMEPFTDPALASLSWEAKLRFSSPTHVCTHLWRCILILSLTLHFGPALSCARAALAIGSTRSINLACARSLIIFLNTLRARIRAAGWARQAIEADEELLAYASGDLQQNSQTTWVSWETHEQVGEAEEMEVQGEVDADRGEWPRVQQLLAELRQERQPVDAATPADTQAGARPQESSERISISHIID